MECHYCSKELTRQKTTRVFRRGERALEVPWTTISCPNGCVDPVGEVFAIADHEQMAANHRRAEQLWSDTFGELMPPPQRAGTHKEVTKDVVVTLRLTPGEATALDQRRGQRTRSHYLRGLIAASGR